MRNTGIFSENAMRYLDLGFSPLPFHGKKPAVKWAGLRSRRVSKNEVSMWMRQYPDANIGTVTGPSSGITVVDADAPGMQEEIFDRFGETPLLASTPRGGLHAFYRYNGEASAIGIEGRPIDIRGDGGLIVLSPSSREDGDYQWVGDVPADLKKLPLIRAESLKKTSINGHAKIPVGRRNEHLFASLRGEVAATAPSNFEAVLAMARSICIRNQLGLPESEVVATAKSVWGLFQKGRLIAPGDRRIFFDPREIEGLLHEPRALALFAKVKASHEPGATFAIAPQGLSRALGWSMASVRKARDILVHLGYVERLSRGGRGKRQPARYRFSGSGGHEGRPLGEF